MPIIKDRKELDRLLGKNRIVDANETIEINLNKHKITGSIEYYFCPTHGKRFIVWGECLHSDCRVKKKTSKMKRFHYIGVGYTEY